MMKKIAVLAALAIATVVYANSVTASYTTGPAASRPNTPTDGMPLMVNGQHIKAINVGIVDYNDGGADEDYVIVAAANAWIFRPQDKMPDGGGGWSRWPLADVSTTFSGGDITLGSITASRGATVTIPSAAVAGTFAQFGNGARVYYQPKTFTTIDGGSQAALIRTTIEGIY